MKEIKRLYLFEKGDGYEVNPLGLELIETADLPFLDIDLKKVSHYEECIETIDDEGNTLESEQVNEYMSVEQLQDYLKLPYNVIKAILKYHITTKINSRLFRSEYDSLGYTYLISDSWVNTLVYDEMERLGLTYTWSCCLFNRNTGLMKLFEILE